MRLFRDSKKADEILTAPTALPESEIQREEWQETSRVWWESQPMRYDWKKKIPYREFTKDFYLEIDKRFFKNAEEYLPPEKIPFDSFINFNSLKDKDVLEIGIGNGSHAQLIAEYSKSFTGIDITDYAVKSTSERMRIFGLKSDIIKMDAEHLKFNDNSFDFVWSWGVIHHSADTSKALKEIHRVLRPGGKAVIMVYYRSWWGYYVMEFIWGIISGNLIRTKSLHKSVQLHTDGAIARYYAFSEWRALVEKLFKAESIGVFGPKNDVLPLPSGKLKSAISGLIPNRLNRFLTHYLRMGTFLVSIMTKAVNL
jgi:SAM-dependent methyltransferase